MAPTTRYRRRNRWRRGLERRFDGILLCEARRQSSPDAGLAAPLGTPQADDVLVYEEQITAASPTSMRAASGRFCVIAGGDHETSEQRLIDSCQRGSQTGLVAGARNCGVQYSIADRGDECVHSHQCR